MAAATNITRRVLPGLVIVTGTFTLDPASIAAGGAGTDTVALAEAKTTDTVVVNPQAALDDGIVLAQAWVSAAGTISIKLENHTAGAIDVGSGTWNFMILRGNAGLPSSG